MRRLRAGRAGATHLAGWVFADLTVVVLLVVLVMTPARPAPKVDPPPSSPPTSLPTSRPAPTQVEPSQPPVLELEEVPKIVIQVDGEALLSGGARGRTAADGLRDDLKQRIAEAGLSGRQAGLLLTFGAAPTPEFRGNIGKRIAQRANAVIIGEVPLFDDARRRAYWTYGASPSFVEIEIFFFQK
ncbi:hypothetical protein ACQP2E_20805 [Actinoplanes sp. CA-015351]|uniref:hypothetical protein n=1 Tax=Actinoplanes sp. CA-015351 TaxID=3239897 RepID=UPI003D960AF3